MTRYGGIVILGPFPLAAVTFNNSGANAYVNNFTVALLAAAGPITFNGSSTFSGSSGLSVSTTSNIVANSGETVSTNAGTVSLKAGPGGIGASGSPFVVSGANLDTAITGNGNQFLSATGSITIDPLGLNAGTGTVELDGGTFTLGGSNRINAGANLNVKGATFAIGANSETVNTLTLTGGSITGSTGVLTSTSTIQTQSGSSSAILAGLNGLNQSTTGTTTLSAANTYTGATTINGGTLQVGIANAIPSGSAVYLANVAGATLNLNSFNDTISSLFGGGTAGGNVTLGSGTLTTGNSTATTFSGIISGTGGLTKVGTGTFLLGGVNTYTGATAINGGTLQVGIASAIPSGSAVTLANVAGATLNLNGFNDTISSLAGGGTTGGNVTLGSGTLTTGNSTATTFSGIISGFGGGLTEVGTGTFTLSGVNTYIGTTTVSAGSLNVLGTGTLGTGLVVDNAQLAYQLNAGTTETVANLISGSGAFSQQGTGSTVVLAAANTYSGTTTISAGSLNVLGTGTLGTGSVVDNAQLVYQLNAGTTETAANLISGSGGFSQQGTGSTVVLTAANTYSGTTTISAGSLNVLGTGTVGTGPVVNNAQLDYQLNAGTTETVANLISGSGVFSQQGTGSTVVLAAANTYTGATTINAGTLQVGIANAISSGSAVTLANVAGATLDLNSFNDTISSLAGGGTTGGNVTLGSGTLTTGNSTATTFSGVISGTGGLTEVGTGTFTLSGVNTYSGTTTISAGYLNVLGTGTLGTGPVLDHAQLDYQLNAGTTETVANLISGGGVFSQQGTGSTVVLAAANTYTGVTYISYGILQAGVANAVGASSAVDMYNNAGATFDLHGFNDTISSLAGGGTTGGNVTLGSGTLTTGNSTATTFSGIISGTGGVTKAGTGTFTLSGVNTYTGATTINAGTLQVGTAIPGRSFFSVLVAPFRLPFRKAS